MRLTKNIFDKKDRNIHTITLENEQLFVENYNLIYENIDINFEYFIENDLIFVKHIKEEQISKKSTNSRIPKFERDIDDIMKSSERIKQNIIELTPKLKKALD